MHDFSFQFYASYIASNTSNTAGEDELTRHWDS